MKELYRYHELPNLIERKRLGLTLRVTASYSDEPRSSTNEFSSKVEQEVLLKEEIKLLEDELRWYQLFRAECREEELAIWDTRFTRMANLTHSTAMDLIPMSRGTYYKYLNMLCRKMRKERVF